MNPFGTLVGLICSAGWVATVFTDDKLIAINLGKPDQSVLNRTIAYTVTLYVFCLPPICTVVPTGDIRL